MAVHHPPTGRIMERLVVYGTVPPYRGRNSYPNGTNVGEWIQGIPWIMFQRIDTSIYTQISSNKCLSGEKYLLIF